MKTKCIIIMWCLCSLTVIAQTKYYVNQTTGNDTNDGLSWSKAFASIQSALDKVTSGNEIWVAAGIYLPTKKMTGIEEPISDRYKTFIIPNGVRLYGGFPTQADDNTGMDKRDWEIHTTVLSGDLNNNDLDDFTNMEDNVYRVVTLFNADKSTLIDGFTITGGNVDYWVPLRMLQGSGICAISNNSFSSPSSPTLRNLIIEGNASTGGGAGFSNYSTGDACPAISNTIIRRNKSGEYGGGFANQAVGKSSPILENVIISGNQAVVGGGMYCLSESTEETSPVLTNVLVHGNRSEISAGGICLYAYLGNIKPVLTNVTIAGNMAGNQGGGLLCLAYSGVSSPEIRNTVISGNKAKEYPNFVTEENNGSIPDIQYSIINESTDISALKFVRAVSADNTPTTDGDYRPDDGSPLINKGHSIFAKIKVDLAGKPRIFDQVVDIGAYEYQQLSSVFIPEIIAEKNIWAENGSLYVKLAQPATIHIYSANGILIRQVKLGEGTQSIDLPQGFYIVSLDSGTGTKVYISK